MNVLKIFSVKNTIKNKKANQNNVKRNYKDGTLVNELRSRKQ